MNDGDKSSPQNPANGPGRKKSSNGASASQAKSGRGGPKAPLIVGIGASAGGLNAFKAFLASMPQDSGMAFVLVQHLAPDHKSMLSELLGRATPMTVEEASDGMACSPNRVYVIPPNATLTIQGGSLRVAKPAPPREHRRPIDTFFRRSPKTRAKTPWASCLREREATARPA